MQEPRSNQKSPVKRCDLLYALADLKHRGNAGRVAAKEQRLFKVAMFFVERGQVSCVCAH
jgi:hypothetical protein